MREEINLKKEEGKKWTGQSDENNEGRKIKKRKKNTHEGKGSEREKRIKTG